MSFIGNIAGAQTAKAIGKFNNALLQSQARYTEAEAARQKQVFDVVEKPKLLDQQKRDYGDFIVGVMSSGAEFRPGTTPYFVGLENKNRQAFNIAYADYQAKIGQENLKNQSLLLQAQGRGELFKGQLTARSQYAAAAGSLLSDIGTGVTLGKQFGFI